MVKSVEGEALSAVAMAAALARLVASRYRLPAALAQDRVAWWLSVAATPSNHAALRDAAIAVRTSPECGCGLSAELLAVYQPAASAELCLLAGEYLAANRYAAMAIGATAAPLDRLGLQREAIAWGERVSGHAAEVQCWPLARDRVLLAAAALDLVRPRRNRITRGVAGAV